jgi:hypothetical protein
MPKLIKKNGQHYIRAPYDFALRPEGVSELSARQIEVNAVFDKGFFNYLCDKGWVAVFRDDIEPASILEDVDEEEAIDEEASDSLSELVARIGAIQKEYSSLGISLEILIKNLNSNQ